MVVFRAASINCPIRAGFDPTWVKDGQLPGQLKIPVFGLTHNLQLGSEIKEEARLRQEGVWKRLRVLASALRKCV